MRFVVALGVMMGCVLGAAATERVAAVAPSSDESGTIRVYAHCVNRIAAHELVQRWERQWNTVGYDIGADQLDCYWEAYNDRTDDLLPLFRSQKEGSALVIVMYASLADMPHFPSYWLVAPTGTDVLRRASELIGADIEEHEDLESEAAVRP
jgi:hypothetical protein